MRRPPSPRYQSPNKGHESVPSDKRLPRNTGERSSSLKDLSRSVVMPETRDACADFSETTGGRIPKEPRQDQTAASQPQRKSRFVRGESAVVADIRTRANHPKRTSRISRWQSRQLSGVRQLPKTSVSMLGIVTAAVLLVVVVAQPVYTWIGQQQQYRDVHAQLVQAQQDQATLKKQIDRWSNPDYIAVEARRRLGYVKPGEVEYLVTGLPAELQKKTDEGPHRPWFMIVADTTKAAAIKTKLTSHIDPNKSSEIGVPADGTRIVKPEEPKKRRR